jgi:hypothetical protein
MCSSFLIVNDISIKGKIVVIILMGILFSLIITLISYKSTKDVLTCFIILLVIVILFLTTKNYIFNARRITVDYQNKILKVGGLLKIIFYEEYKFSEIKLIEYYEQEEHIIDYGKSWQTVIKILNKNDEKIYFGTVSKVMNYDNLEKFCSPYFKVRFCVKKPS